MTQRTRAAVLAFLVAGVAALTLRSALVRVAIQPGTAEELWELATGLPFARGESPPGGILPAIDGQFAYFGRSRHGQDLFRAPTAEVLRMLPRVLQDLNVGVRVRGLSPAVSTGYARWVASGGDVDEDPVATATSLLKHLYEAELEASLMRFPSAASELRLREENARELWGRAQRAWITVAFEILFLAGWLAFVAWPWIGDAPARRWFVHLALAPVQLYLPHARGYAPWGFGPLPSGGFLYPAVLVVALLPALLFPRTAIDAEVRESLPALLEPLNQLPGAPMVWTAEPFGFTPTGVLAYGILLGTIGFILRRRIDERLPAAARS